MKTLFGEVFIVAILGILSVAEGIRLVNKENLQTTDMLGPGYYSIGVGAFLLMAGAAYFLSRRKKISGVAQDQPAAAPAGNAGYNRTMLGMVVVMIAYIVLMDVAGYLLSTAVFFLLINRIAGFRSWLVNAGVSALMTAAFYLVFVEWLGIIFPRGLLADW
jgi:putative tricarboxylic transport membrane protein